MLFLNFLEEKKETYLCICGGIRVGDRGRQGRPIAGRSSICHRHPSRQLTVVPKASNVPVLKKRMRLASRDWSLLSVTAPC